MPQQRVSIMPVRTQAEQTEQHTIKAVAIHVGSLGGVLATCARVCAIFLQRWRAPVLSTNVLYDTMTCRKALVARSVCCNGVASQAIEAGASRHKFDSSVNMGTHSGFAKILLACGSICAEVIAGHMLALAVLVALHRRADFQLLRYIMLMEQVFCSILHDLRDTIAYNLLRCTCHQHNEHQFTCLCEHTLSSVHPILSLLQGVFGFKTGCTEELASNKLNMKAWLSRQFNIFKMPCC